MDKKLKNQVVVSDEAHDYLRRKRSETGLPIGRYVDRLVLREKRMEEIENSVELEFEET